LWSKVLGKFKLRQAPHLLLVPHPMAQQLDQSLHLPGSLKHPSPDALLVGF
jgi:hypothetical protein